MDKLLLTLTLLAFSSGVLCNVAQNVIEDGSTAVQTQLNNTVYTLEKVCTSGAVRDDYVVIQGMGAYKLHTNLMLTWNEARKVCMDEGGQLAVINSSAEAMILVDWFLRENVHNPIWIGTHDLFELGKWVTLTGETVAAAGYDQWAPGEPNNQGGLGHCGCLHAFLNGLCVSQCNVTRSYFCEINLC